MQIKVQRNAIYILISVLIFKIKNDHDGICFKMGPIGWE